MKNWLAKLIQFFELKTLYGKGAPTRPFPTTRSNLTECQIETIEDLKCCMRRGDCPGDQE